MIIVIILFYVWIHQWTFYNRVGRRPPDVIDLHSRDHYLYIWLLFNTLGMHTLRLELYHLTDFIIAYLVEYRFFFFFDHDVL